MRTEKQVWVAALAMVAGSLAIATSAVADESRSGQRRSSSEPVALLDAIQNESIAVVVRPLHAREVRVEIRNKTDQALRIEFPKTLVAAPVLAQFLPPGNPFGPPGGNGNGLFNGGGGQGAPPQVLGVAAQPNFANAPGPNNRRNNPFIFNVPAEKIVRVTLSSLCLEYGKREPNPRNTYELRPLESFTDNSAVRELLETYGRGDVREEVAQIAAWHLASDMSWETMAGMTKLRSYGKVENVFNADALKAAKKLVDGLPSSRKSERSPSNRVASSQPVSRSP